MKIFALANNFSIDLCNKFTAMGNFSLNRGTDRDIISMESQNFKMSVEKDRILAVEESGPLYWISLYRDSDNFNSVAAGYVFEVLSSNAPKETEIPLFREAIAFYMYSFPNSRNYLTTIPEFSDFYPGEANWDDEDTAEQQNEAPALPDPF